MDKKDRIVKFEKWDDEDDVYRAVFNTAGNIEIDLSLNQVFAEIQTESPLGRQREEIIELEKAVRSAPHKNMRKDIQAFKAALG